MGTEWSDTHSDPGDLDQPDGWEQLDAESQIPMTDEQREQVLVGILQQVRGLNAYLEAEQAKSEPPKGALVRTIDAVRRAMRQHRNDLTLRP